MEVEYKKINIHTAGPSALAGVLVFGLLMVLSSCLLRCSKKIRVKVMAVADKRIKAISEIISGIKVGRDSVTLQTNESLTKARLVKYFS